MNAQEAKRLVSKNFDRRALKETVVRIAQTPCPQTELYEREPLILRAIREMYRPAFERAGCDTWIDDYGNLIATQGEGTSGKSVMFLSYAMTWTEGTMTNPWSGEVMDGAQFGVDGEVVWGRGGSEYHPTNAGILECARLIHDSGIRVPGKITYVVSSAGHTSSGDPAIRLVYNDDLTADMCVMPGNNFVMLGNHGRLDLRVNVYGKSVHSGGELSAGSNAIEGGLEAIRRLQAIMPLPPKGTIDPDMGQGRLSIIGIASYPFSPGYHNGVGSGGHTLQNLFRFMLDRRLVPGERVQAAIAEIQDAVGDLSPWRVTYERGAYQLPTKHAKDAPIIRSIAQAYEVMLEREPDYQYVQYTIDAGFTNKLGIPTAMWGGIDMRFAHGDTDICQLQVCEDVAKGYTFWALANTA
ncbi:MAG TPA: peptidase dimerization domain-containing protein [Candidatus Saccharimonadales bacterium]|nr:peptidase dimerization domain-containing protein [Candidatus Saccharimonadales bacterium]